MRKEHFRIGPIPALLWGDPGEKLMIAVHGDQSHKEDDVIALLAEVAVGADYQVLSFDLAEHGDRRETGEPCKVQNSVEDLRAVMEYARSRWDRVSLFGCSLGAYFSLMAYSGDALEQCLFLSPVVDMRRLIENMMLWSGVSEERLREEGEIPTAFGKTLYWGYYCYVREHPVAAWDKPTSILYGEKDTLSEYSCVSRFAERFRCELTVLPDGEHFFHTQPQMDFFRDWVEQALSKERLRDEL